MTCKKCGQVVEEGFNNCPNCGENLNGKKTKKPIFKKWWFWLIVALVVFAIIGSSGNNDEDAATQDNPTDVVVDGNSTSTDSASPTETESADAQTWSKNFYVDDFDEPTDEWYVSRSFLGTFSNSATTDSRLSGNILIDEENVCIFLYEYYTHQVKNSYSRSKDYVINVRLEDGTTKNFSGCIYSEGDRICVDGSEATSLKNLLVTGGKMKFYVYEKDNSVTNYLFEISSDNLKDLIG